MKFKIKSLDDRVYKELEEFKKLGYEVTKQTSFFITLKKYNDIGRAEKEIELYIDKNTAIKFDVKGSGILNPFTKEELKILDFYDWDLHDYMKNPVGQDVTDWVNNDEV
jgi:hypothetical protein